MTLPAKPAWREVPAATIVISLNDRKSSSVISISSRKTWPDSGENLPRRGVAHGARLFVNFFHREVLEAALLRQDRGPR